MKIYNKPISREKMKKANAATVFTMIRFSEGVSRNAIAKATGLNPSTVSLIVDDLIARDLVEETSFSREPDEDVQIGRRPIGLKLNGIKYRLIGLEFTGNGISAGLFDFTCAEPLQTVHRRVSLRESAADNAIGLVRTLIERGGSDNVVGVGLGVPGIVDNRHKDILLSVPMQVENLRIGEEIARAVNLPVYVENESKLKGLYEKQRYHQEVDLLAYVSVAIGIGGCVISRDRFLMGSVGAAGEIGHMSIRFDGRVCRCGNRGCLETYAGTEALTERIMEILGSSAGDRPMTMAEIAEAFRAGNSVVREAVMENADFVADGVINVVNFLNPKVVVIGGEVLAFGEEYVQRIERKVHACSLRPYGKHVEVCAAHELDFPIARGAAMLAADELMKTII